jgi:hypothetical protein
MYSYDDVHSACQGLLVEAVEIATACNHRFAVVGGWSPFFLNNAAGLHPGSRDVDLLFDAATKPKSLESVVKAFLQRGYLLSAKHDFQLLRLATVRSQQLVFNVDLLHPFEANTDFASEMFVKQIELPIPDSKFIKNYRYVKSVMLPDSQFIFDYNRIARVSVNATTPSGAIVSCQTPVADEAAILVTKSKSMSLPKRPRDTFDLFLATAFCRDREETVSFFRETLQHQRVEVYSTLFQIAVNLYLDDKSSAKISEFSLRKELIPQDCTGKILNFLMDAGINLNEAQQEAESQRQAAIPSGFRSRIEHADGLHV